MFSFKYPYGLKRKQSAKIAQKGTGNSGECSTNIGNSFAIPFQIALRAFQPKMSQALRKQAWATVGDAIYIWPIAL